MSVIDADHRPHEVPNLFSSTVAASSPRAAVPPTMTIQVLAFRGAERIARLAKAGSI